MRKLLLSIFVNISLLAFVSCDVHEWPDSAELVAVDLRVDVAFLVYEWEDGEITDSIDVVQKKGLMRYNIKVYSGFAASRASAVLVKNVEFTRDLSEGYGCSYTLELPGGNGRGFVGLGVRAELFPRPGGQSCHIFKSIIETLKIQHQCRSRQLISFHLSNAFAVKLLDFSQIDTDLFPEESIFHGLVVDFPEVVHHILGSQTLCCNLLASRCLPMLLKYSHWAAISS